MLKQLSNKPLRWKQFISQQISQRMESIIAIGLASLLIVAIVWLARYNGQLRAEIAQIEKEAESAKKQRDIATKPTHSGVELINIMRDGKL